MTAANLGRDCFRVGGLQDIVITHMGIHYMMWGGIVAAYFMFGNDYPPKYIDQMILAIFFAWEKANSCVKIKSGILLRES